MAEAASKKGAGPVKPWQARLNADENRVAEAEMREAGYKWKTEFIRARLLDRRSADNELAGLQLGQLSLLANEMHAQLEDIEQLDDATRRSLQASADRLSEVCLAAQTRLARSGGPT